MSTNNRISTIVSSQLPDFVRSEHPNFVAFLEAYYEYLEQSNTSIQFGKTVERTKNMLNYLDIDRTIDGFAQKFYDQFLGLIPKDVSVDKAFILKNVKDFYRARGTEKSFRFLFRALFNEEPEFYYPKNDILIASSGKWFIEKSLRITNMTGGDSLENLRLFDGLRIRGVNSGATAIVERVAVSFESLVGELYELFLSNVTLGTGQIPFENGEQITATDLDGVVLTATILSGRIETLSINQSGSGYSVGDPLVFTGDGTGAAAVVSRVSTGNVAGVLVVDGGTGFRQNDVILFSGGGGTGANATVFTVSNTVTYNINSDVVNTYNATVIGAYSNGANGNANTTLVSTLSYETLNVGTITSIAVSSSGNNYISVPSADPVGNTKLKTLGILGRLRINAGGAGYANGELLQFTNVPNGYGFGANGSVTVNSSGAIVSATLTPLSGFLTGGVGYNPNFLPQISVNTSGGSGANITVSSVLSYGSPFTELDVRTTELGKVEALSVTARGENYSTPPSVSITTTTGDGNANVTATVSTGTFTYPGRFLDDTGFPSSFNYLQDRDYYQNYSYVIRVRESIEKYRLYLKNILSPAGFKLWGDYILDESDELQQQVTMANSTIVTKYSPSLFYNFIEEDVFDGLSYTLLGGGLTYFDEDGVLRTASANTWPLEYGPSNLAVRGRPVWTARSNLVLHSGDLTASGWTTNGTSRTVGATAPDGVSTYTRLTVTATTNAHELFRSFTSGAGTTYTQSAIVRYTGSQRWIRFQLFATGLVGDAWFDLQNGVWGTITAGTTAHPVENLRNGQYRIAISAPSSGAGTGYWTIVASPSNGFAGAWLGAGTTFDVWAAQIEAGFPFPTAYIPTTASTVTRLVSVIQRTPLGAEYNPSAFTLSVTGIASNVVATGTNYTFSAFQNTSGFGVQNGLLRIDGGGAPTSYISRGTVASDVIAGSAGSVKANTIITMTMAVQANNFAFAANGILIGTDTNTGGLVPSGINVLLFAGGAQDINGWLRKAALYPTRVPNSHLPNEPDDLYGEL